jgi:hypothetical protein
MGKVECGEKANDAHRSEHWADSPSVRQEAADGRAERKADSRRRRKPRLRRASRFGRRQIVHEHDRDCADNAEVDAVQCLNAHNPKRPSRPDIEEQAKRHKKKREEERRTPPPNVRPPPDLAHHQHFADNARREHSGNKARRRAQLLHVRGQILRRAVERELIAEVGDEKVV